MKTHSRTTRDAKIAKEAALYGPAAEKVLGTTELFENIVTFLPANEIVLAHRVSRTWQATFGWSPSLQSVLGFTTKAIDPKEWIKRKIGVMTPGDMKRDWFWNGEVVHDHNGHRDTMLTVHVHAHVARIFKGHTRELRDDV